MILSWIEDKFNLYSYLGLDGEMSAAKLERH